jgi:hypothetical protein
VARLEWAPGGGLGRVVIGKVRPALQDNPSFHFSRSNLITDPPSDVRLDPTGPKGACAVDLSRFISHLTQGN